jgi:hypothetical protein
MPQSLTSVHIDSKTLAPSAITQKLDNLYNIKGTIDSKKGWCIRFFFLHVCDTFQIRMKQHFIILFRFIITRAHKQNDFLL